MSSRRKETSQEYKDRTKSNDARRADASRSQASTARNMYNSGVGGGSTWGSSSSSSTSSSSGSQSAYEKYGIMPSEH